MINRIQIPDPGAAGIVKLAGVIFVAILAVTLFFKSWFSVNNHEVMALTYPNGQVEFYTTPGFYGQWFGHTESFEKRKQYPFEEKVQLTTVPTRPSRVPCNIRSRSTRGR